MYKYLLAILLLPVSLRAVEIKFDFSQTPTNQMPTNCFSTAGGDGKPGIWKVLMDELPVAFEPISALAPRTAPKAVIAQLDWNVADEHFPMLQLGKESYGDFTMHTRFKMVDGLTEQMAGVAFRIQDDKNYYYVRASALGNTFCFYRVNQGQRTAESRVEMKFEKGTWYNLTIQCTGPKIHVMIDGKDALPLINDIFFSSGKIALLTKSDAISYFTDVGIDYAARGHFVQEIVRDVIKENPRLLGLKIYMAPPSSTNLQMVASNDEKEIGQPADSFDGDVIKNGVNYYRKDKETVYVTMPLRDRNGDPVAAVKFIMKSFVGQTEDNALIRAQPMLKEMQARASAVETIY